MPAQEDASRLFHEVVQSLQERGPRVPLATYRLQLNASFDFDAAREVLGHLAELGVSDVYTSPFLKARRGSEHGYDVTAHDEVNPELGGAAGLERYTLRMKALGLGQVFDFVPNHMGTGSDNAWWMDVLENGPGSPFAPFFDVDWHPHKAELEDKVLLPVLGDPYGQVLERGDLKVRYDVGAFFVDIPGDTLPVSPLTYEQVLQPMLSPLVETLGDEDDAVLELQSILTGLRHLPPRTERQRARVKERQREKEILKRRLSALVEGSAEVASALQVSLQRLNGQPGDPHSFDALHRLLEQQAYRLSFWRTAAEEINYRRFFDINDLAAIRMERPEVFAHTHTFLLGLVREQVVTGLRIDHPDGLWDPGGYFHALQRGCFVERCRTQWRGDEASFAPLVPHLIALWNDEVRDAPGCAAARACYVLVEKILSRGETLPADWPVHGTTGYDFTVAVGALFTDPAGDVPLATTWTRFAGPQPAFDTLVYEKKKLVLDTSLASELSVLAWQLDKLSERDRHTRDFTLGSLHDALREVIACFPVYRTYVTETATRIDERDRQAVMTAVRSASHRNAGVDASIFRFVRDVLLSEQPSGERRDFVLRFQQLTGPVMAKGVEDTAFYLWNKLVSLNEVGGEPERFSLDVPAFHRLNAERQARWPHAMLALSTHDTKRSADVRARIGVLSELCDEWDEVLPHLALATLDFKRDADGLLAPDRNEEYLLYQTVLGTLPFDGPGGDGHEAWVARLVDYMRKATKEAKVHTSWVNAAPEYDAAVEGFVKDALAVDSPLWRPLSGLAHSVAFHGAFSSLSQTLLQLTSPGVPDVYQGNESWDFSLVDPDNRRPVDYARLRTALADVMKNLGQPGYAASLVEHFEDGRIKTLVVHAALQLRRRMPEAFGADAMYEPLEATGEQRDHVVAFTRAQGSKQLVTVAPRLTARLAGGRRAPPVGPIWTDTEVAVPDGQWRDVFTHETFRSRGSLPLHQMLAAFPVALLERIP